MILLALAAFFNIVCMTKTLLLILFTVAFTLFSCRRDSETVYRERSDSLNHLLQQRDSSVNALLLAFSQIEKNLDSVAGKQNLISLSMNARKGDVGPGLSERINAQIGAINALMEQNAAQMKELDKKLKGSNLRIGEFNRMIARLNKEVQGKNTELQQLNMELGRMNEKILQLQITLDTLGMGNERQADQIAAQTASLRTAYYLVGKIADLKEMKVIDKNGGVLGMGKSAQLNPDFDPAKFTKIDYTQVLSIPVFSAKAKIVTSHPGESYELDKEGNEYTNLRIIQPEKFWSASKFLVIISN
jgi:hypothetical protein